MGLAGNSLNNSFQSHQGVVTFSRRLRFYILWNCGSSTQTYSKPLWTMGLSLKPELDITAVLRSLIYAFRPGWMSPLSAETWGLLRNSLPHRPNGHRLPNSRLYIHFLGNFPLGGNTMDSFNLIYKGSKWRNSPFNSKLPDYFINDEWAPRVGGPGRAGKRWQATHLFQLLQLLFEAVVFSLQLIILLFEGQLLFQYHQSVFGRLDLFVGGLRELLGQPLYLGLIMVHRLQSLFRGHSPGGWR